MTTKSNAHNYRAIAQTLADRYAYAVHCLSTDAQDKALAAYSKFVEELGVDPLA